MGGGNERVWGEPGGYQSRAVSARWER